MRWLMSRDSFLKLLATLLPLSMVVAGCRTKLSAVQDASSTTSLCPNVDTSIYKNCQQVFTLTNGKKILVYSNIDLSVGPHAATKAAQRNPYTHIIIGGHGAGGSPRGTFEAIAKALVLAKDTRTAVLAPWWGLALEDVPPEGIASFESWDKRDDFAAGLQTKLRDFNTYDVLNDFSKQMRSFVPGIAQLTFAGFSAGGQTMQRYAASSDGNPNKDPNLAVHFVVGSPSGYYYWDKLRISGAAVCTDKNHCALKATDFVPSAYDNCSTYNQYKFGGDNLPPYLHFNINTYLSNNISFIVSEGDASAATGAEGPLQGDPCGNTSQGPKGYSFRMQRGLTYYAYMHLVAAPAHGLTTSHHHLYVLDSSNVPGGPCAHDDHCVYGSATGQRVLTGAANPVGEWILP